MRERFSLLCDLPPQASGVCVVNRKPGDGLRASHRGLRCHSRSVVDLLIGDVVVTQPEIGVF